MANLTSSRRIPELDGLRGIAILLVLLFHYFYHYPDASYQPAGLIRNTFLQFERSISLGWTGVDLFFVLSGFLIGGILLDARSSPLYFKAFYVRRLYRIVPLYYVWILTYVVVLLLADSLFKANTSSFGGPPASSRLYLLPAFLQNFGVVGYSRFARAWFQPTWSLAVEEQFYLLAPLVIRVFSRRQLFWLIGLVIFLAPSLRLWIRYHVPATGFEPAYELMPCRADALAMGILAALLWRSGAFRSWLSDHAFLFYGLAGISLAGVVVLGSYSPVYWSLSMESIGYTWIAGFYTAILLLALGAPSGLVARVARMGWLRELGRVSYCLYIIHTGVAYLCQGSLQAGARHIESWQTVLVNVPAALIVFFIARFSWTYFEHPLLSRGHSHHYFPDRGANGSAPTPEAARVALGT
jgi:peptidoglycan/LPS O-acetylase OafA/YrhL